MCSSYIKSCSHLQKSPKNTAALISELKTKDLHKEQIRRSGSFMEMHSYIAMALGINYTIYFLILQLTVALRIPL